MTYLLSKSKLQSFKQCPRKLWLEVHKRDLAARSEAQELVLKRGTEFGNSVRDLFPGGILISEAKSEEAVEQTSKFLDQFATEGAARPLFEAAFAYNQLIVRVDILVPKQDGTWRLIEVKTGSSDLEKKTHYIRDAAIQAYVIGKQRDRLVVSDVYVGMPNASFVLGDDGNLEGILKLVDVTTQSWSLAAEFDEVIEGAYSVIKSPDQPIAAVGSQCKLPNECAFSAYCSGVELNAESAPKVAVWHLAKSPLTKVVQQLIPRYKDLRDVPEALLKDPMHVKMREIATGKTPYFFDIALKQYLDSQPFPRVFLDFETNNAPLPTWTGSRPGEVVPFQFSIHRWESSESPPSHFEFIAQTREDPRRNLAASLCEFIQDGDHVYAWNGKKTEGPIVEKLISILPEHKVKLSAIAESCKINDPLPHFKKGMYFPAMRGDWGLKSVAKALLSENPYEGLKIKNGVQAMIGYERFLKLDDAEERSLLRADLLAYCAVDTLVMYEIWKVLQCRRPSN